MSQKDRNIGYRKLFAKELQLAEDAKRTVDDRTLAVDELYMQHQQLAEQYEKLLKTTIKLSRISDIQGNTLKEQELVIQTANDNLKRLEQLRKQLIADISHELGTPMVAVQGYVKAMLDGVIGPEEKYLQLIYDNVLKVNHLIKDLFLLSTYQANQTHFEHERVEAAHFLNQMCAKYVPDCERSGIAFELEPCSLTSVMTHGDYAMIVWCDPIRLEQAFDNVLQNAVKYTREGGRISVVSEFQPKYEGALLGHWFVKISDTGIGMEEEEAGLVFERFYRSKRAKAQGIQGNGLGLAITKEIIQKHGGEIGVTSKPGEGTSFFILLPAERVARADGQAGSMMQGGYR
ncbi:cell wall metabolism sensor histidine kinase WalK [Paenibacillus sp. YYML68]|uniref:sensor histidine kinase n=1 Tax=Paenibacillus sp. YYML68 TaxID=2909250 RepID=UPI002492B974|nr:HAMP domain-containing sensor histidine kinase [Paenibacillus sp. YYML68]